jgi:glycosyltransferase involved in cell wall biosynthesis
MNKMNIGILTFPLIEAGNIPLSNLVDILKPLSNDLYLITGNDGYTFFKDDKKIHTYGVEYNVRKHISNRILNYTYAQLRISHKLIKLYKNVDLWIFFIGGDILLLPMVAAKLLKKKVILLSAGSSFQCSKSKDANLSKPIKLLEHMNRSLSNQNILYSKNIIKEWKLEKYAHKTSVAHEHFLNLDKFRIDNKFSERYNLVGYIGALSEEKGILEFVESVPKILKEKGEIEFLIGGGGRLRGVIERYLSDRSLKCKVELAGWISHDEVPGYLNQLKLLVLPSYTEGLPNIMLEAMACGTPVLASPVGAIPDFIKDGETGFLMEDNSPECIAANVIRALENPDLQSIAKRSRTLVENEFTFDKAVERWEKILEEISEDK